MSLRVSLLSLFAGSVSLAISSLSLAAAPWTEGPASKPDFFPIGVWTQEPAHAERYKVAGINTYVGLWAGPTEKQLAALKQAGMFVICEQNEVGLKHKDDLNILAWLLPDEPDNAQPKIDPVTKRKDGWDRCVPPATVIAWYEKAKASDPSRPVLVNFGMGMVDLKWPGRGVGAKQADYLEYVKSGDIVSFDIYPAAHYGGDNPPLHRVGEGVRLLHEWTANKKPVWTVIECTAIHDHAKKPTPQQVKAEVWMALTSGADGLLYFCHQFAKPMNTAAPLADAPMLEAITAINKQITELASVLNSSTPPEQTEVKSSNGDVTIRTLTKRHDNQTYLFAVAEQKGGAKATFTLPAVVAAQAVEVIGEDRSIPVTGGKFEDEFTDYAVHLYRFK